MAKELVNISKMDIASNVWELFQNNSLWWNEDDKIDIVGKKMVPRDDFILVRTHPDHRCMWWHDIWFPCYGIIPTSCQTCWKVVCKPRKLPQLFALLDLMLNKDTKPCKCGIERRESVSGLYGGYFYNDSLEEGRERYNSVKKAMLEDEVLAPLLDEVNDQGFPTRLILKRACTEYEIRVHSKQNIEHRRSDEWEITPEQLELEERLNASYAVAESKNRGQTTDLKAHIIATWIEFAASNGDDTYLQYTGGQPFYPKYITYHEDSYQGPVKAFRLPNESDTTDKCD